LRHSFWCGTIDASANGLGRENKVEIRKMIDELYKELSRGDEKIYVMKDDVAYNFNIGIDDNGQPLIILTHPYEM
jgi:ATP/maltotriose-dependent transcriptional regulator MalT